jgi:hypothetical protein
VRHRRIIRNDIDVFGGMTIDRTRAYCPADALLPGVVHLSPLCNLSPPDLRGGLFFTIRGSLHRHRRLPRIALAAAEPAFEVQISVVVGGISSPLSRIGHSR